MKAKNLIYISMFFTGMVLASCGGERGHENMAPSDEMNNEGASSNDDYKAEATEAYDMEEEAAAPATEKLMYKDENKKNEAQSNLSEIFSSSAATVDPDDTIHKFIRTADIRFKVTNVARSTYKIEDITRRFKGFVTYTNLTSDINNKRRRIVSNDSVLETTYFTVNNTITIRVPSANLDTTLKEISKLVDYLDYRVVSANDVRFQILSNKLKKRRLANYQNRMSKISDNGGVNKIDDKAYVEENILQKQEQADNALIQDLTLFDQIDYSTVTLYIYQNEEMLNELVANEENIEDYRPGMGSRSWESIKTGWYVIEDIVVGLIAAWPLWILLSIIFIILRRNGLLKRKSKE